MVAMDDSRGSQRLSQIIEGLKAIRVFARCLMGNQDIGFEPLEGLNILGEDGAAVFAR